ncbi:hypothetical protein [Halobacteriovorax sp. HLS]|uniref:hypothetical protein n=1 Tax=Halobacteriovorax sp. HLS TaxID=2234000 RepID=UPI000FD6ED46|nr:hypothetical protein [Halobacteriovorax sp. HLS]
MENLKTIPMSTEEIQEIFLNSDLHYNIDLKNSTLKGEAFVTYIANMQINCSLADIDQTPKEEKFEVLKYFLNFRQTIKCDTLLHTTALLLLKALRAPVDQSRSWLSEEESEEFLQNNKELMLQAALFINSAPVFVAAFNKDFKEEIFTQACEDGEIQVIDDPEIVGINLINLFSIPDFTETFIAQYDNVMPPETKQLRYYKAQVERLQYDKKTVFDIFLGLKEKSFLMSFSHLLLNNSSEKEELSLLESYI